MRVPCSGCKGLLSKPPLRDAAEIEACMKSRGFSSVVVLQLCFHQTHMRRDRITCGIRSCKYHGSTLPTLFDRVQRDRCAQPPGAEAHQVGVVRRHPESKYNYC